jgi:hypothetical protein
MNTYTWTIVPNQLSGAVLIITKRTPQDKYQYARLYAQDLLYTVVQAPSAMTQDKLAYLFEHADEYQLTPPTTLLGCRPYRPPTQL